ncbi:hypothetical protein LAG90_05240 [Marinilongibacter aquaticus]|uniref:hypothetical protein n=1 Tax=Marinilongibacter aquaticus TaxID=2975157 RepID=UPI0021BCFD81|nr:hypothetical protein [Marinilongibacter aquaticus]UBM60049.1 hypothetical protein LAG90_05240 [Marinilongibacter aquaticus]
MKYIEKLSHYQELMNVAIWALEAFPNHEWPEDYYKSFIERYKTDLKERSEIKSGKYASVASLNHDISNALIYFNEASGEAVEQFWKRIQDENLPFKRENKLKKVLKRKRIINETEYDFVIDVLGPYIQQGIISEEEGILLKQYIGDFEMKGKA